MNLTIHDIRLQFKNILVPKKIVLFTESTNNPISRTFFSVTLLQEHLKLNICSITVNMSTENDILI